MTTAAVVIIGTEILTGKFRDENGPFLVDRLRALGVSLRRIATIPDDLDVIADEVRRVAAACDVVITSGGVGPTHDDLTLEGVARAFGVDLELRVELVAVMQRFSIPLDEANLRMARVPAGTELLPDPTLAYPVTRVRNVYVLPGVPKLLRAKFEAIAPRFAGERPHLARLYVDAWETAIAARLTAVAAAHPAVEIGSYPRTGEGAFKVLLTFEAADPGALEAAVAAARAALPCVPPPAQAPESR